MINKTYQIKPMCSCLINQNCYIGEDPIGHNCLNKAYYIYKNRWYICEECFSKLTNFKFGNDIITLPNGNDVRLQDQAIKRLKERINNVK